MAIITPERAGEIRAQLVEQYAGTWLQHYAGAIEDELTKQLAIRQYELAQALEKIYDLAHDKSTGPAVPDTYWEIRNIAQEAL